MPETPDDLVRTTDPAPPCPVCGSPRTYWGGMAPDGDAPMAGCARCHWRWQVWQVGGVGGFQVKRREKAR